MADKNTATCKQPAGMVAPVIDSHRCEGKEDCVRVCPYGVFEVRKLTDDERGALPFFVRLKVAVHGGKQAFAIHADQCHSCGLCVTACPERAIKLTRIA